MRTAALWAMVACAGCIGTPAHAQDIRVTAPAPAPEESSPPPLTPAESETLARALNFDPAALATAAKPLRLPGFDKPPTLALKRDEHPDGSGSMAVKQPVPLDGVAADVGADVSYAAPPDTVYRPGQPLPGRAGGDAGTGAAWASLGMPNLASLDARADPTQDQGKLAGTLKRSLPLGRAVSLTLADSYSVTQSLGAPPASSAPALPSPATAAAAAEPIWNSDKSLSFDLKSTGTTLGAGFTTASNDPLTHNKLSADQRIAGPLHVTTAVTDLGEADESRSIAAGLKLNW